MRQSITYIILIFLVISLYSCNQSSKKTDFGGIKVEFSQPAIDLAQLYSFYHSDPITQKQKEENVIIDYIAANDLMAIRLDNGVYRQVVKKGTGKLIAWGDKLEVNYEGNLLDGTGFDSSYKRGKPINFRVGEMIDGWNQGLMGIPVGSEIILIIPSHLAYKEEGLKHIIGPSEILKFRIDILSSKSK